MKIIIFFLASSLLRIIGFPIIAYTYYKKLKLAPITVTPNNRRTP